VKPVVNLPAISSAPARAELLVERRRRARSGRRPRIVIDAAATQAQPSRSERAARAYRAQLDVQCGLRLDTVA
jgi:hypothetical protein